MQAEALYWIKRTVKAETKLEKVKELRDLVWGLDIPHPTIPAYHELHEKMQIVLKFIEGILE